MSTKEKCVSTHILKEKVDAHENVLKQLWQLGHYAACADIQPKINELKTELYNRRQSDRKKLERQASESHLIFLGTGHSGAVPSPAHLIKAAKAQAESSKESGEKVTGNNQPNGCPQTSPCGSSLPKADQLTGTKVLKKCNKKQNIDGKKHFVCPTCTKAVADTPENCKNYRGNPSLLIRYVGVIDQKVDESQSSEAEPQDLTPCQQRKTFNIQIDVTKTFREATLRWLIPNGIEYLDAIFLTHHHADAILGMDDLRSIQHYKKGKRERGPVPVDVYCSKNTYESIRNVFPYLVPDLQDTVNKEKRNVAALSFRLIEPFEPVNVGGLDITPFPVLHGEDCEVFAYEFGRHERVVYMSDVSRIPQISKDFLLKSPIDILIVDCLGNKKHNTHFNFDECVECIKELSPKHAYLTGMCCDLEYDATTKRLEKALIGTGVVAKPGFDGQAIFTDLDGVDRDNSPI